MTGWKGFINKEIWAGRICFKPVRELSDSNNNHKKTEDPQKGIRLLIIRLGCHQVELILIQKFYRQL